MKFIYKSSIAHKNGLSSFHIVCYWQYETSLAIWDFTAFQWASNPNKPNSISENGPEWWSQRCLIPASSLPSQSTIRKYGRWGGQLPAVGSPFAQTYSHCGLFSPVILSGFQVFQMERKVDVAPQEDLDVRSACLAEERSINHSLLCNFWVWRDLVILVPLIFGCYHQILQFLLGESED